MDASGLDRRAGGLHMNRAHCRSLTEANVLVCSASAESCRQLVGSAQ